MKTTKTTIRIGDTLHVFIGTAGDAVQMAAWEAGLRAKLVADGHGMERGDGSREWLADEAILDKAGQYTWDKTGNRVAHRRMRYTRDAAGKVSGELVKKVWKSP